MPQASADMSGMYTSVAGALDVTSSSFDAETSVSGTFGMWAEPTLDLGRASYTDFAVTAGVRRYLD